VQATVDVPDLLHGILTCVTAGPGLGFNRAVLFLADEGNTELSVAMAIGPATPEEARLAWTHLANECPALTELVRRSPGANAPTGIQALLEGVSVPLDGAGSSTPDGNPLRAAFLERRIVRLTDAASMDGLPPRLRQALGGVEAVCVPLLAKDRAIGLIVADNAFNHEPVDDGRVQLLQLLAVLGGLAIDNARIYARVERQATELRATLATLEATQDQLIHAERLATVGAVVARVSHEVRNPLATIGGFAGMLRKSPDDPRRVARDAGIIAEEVRKLESLLKEMLDFTSPRPPRLARLDVDSLVRSFVEVHRPELAAAGIGLTLDLEPELPWASADANQVQQVLLNLWQNAVQALEGAPAGRERRIGLRTWQQDGAVRLAVADTGSGIPPDLLPRIFTPFFTTKQRGTGLGLAVVKKVIDDHHGSLLVESEEGRGTTFVVALPIAR
jgi:signal transduction histidine kinase